MARKEFERTCQRCGNVQYAPLKAPPKPSRLAVAGAKLQAAGSSGSLFDSGKTRGGYAIQALRLEQQRDAWEAYKHPTCTSCGSQSLKTRVVRVKVH